ncbi:MAG TPA: response regulator transcription factor [Gaiellaceae bacterium]|nr:response regulator transcription factor [Gaiellaceae bacterium]
MEVRCLVADDHPAVLNAVSDYLTEEGIEIVARARDGKDALAKIESMHPDVAIVDLRMPQLSGIDVARDAVRSSPATAVILYTGFAEQALLVEAVDAGARGVVLKEAPLADLVRAIEIVAGGGTYVDPALAGVLASGNATGKLTELSERQRDVLRLLANGNTYEEIGRQLFIATETVRTHVQKAMRQLDANTRTQAVATALRQELIA